MRSDRNLATFVLAAVAVALTLTLSAGCQRSMAKSSVVDTYPDAAGELDYWDKVATRRAVTNNDALHGLLLTADNASPATWEERLAAARDHGWIGANDTLDANATATMGTVAVAACDILHIKGGLTMRVFGPSPRYCVKELVYLEMIPSRSDNQSLSGLEFIDVISRIEDRRNVAAAAPAGQ
ncbi:MAG: hypothetical protein GC159_03380 [Phycisphaera sp.]|nr:hypothetical protein [Phycisphaera sp.]